MSLALAVLGECGDSPLERPLFPLFPSGLAGAVVSVGRLSLQPVLLFGAQGVPDWGAACRVAQVPTSTPFTVTPQQFGRALPASWGLLPQPRLTG